MNDEELIYFVEQNECLFNKKSPQYKNYAKKDMLWAQIGHKLGVAGEDCAKRWSAIRDRFCKEVRYMQSERAANKPPRWPLYCLMLFMENHITSRKYGNRSIKQEKVEEEKDFDPLSPMPVENPQSPSSTLTLQITDWPDAYAKQWSPVSPPSVAAPSKHRKRKLHDTIETAEESFVRFERHKHGSKGFSRSFADFMVNLMEPLSETSKLELVREFTQLIVAKRLREGQHDDFNN